MCLLGILILSAGAFFADLTATLTGRVTAPTGTTMSGVEVRAINVETGLRFATQTDEEGLYRITNLPPGTYRVVLQKHGFQSIVKPGVELHVQDVIALNFELLIGSVDQSITAEEGTPLLQAETAVLGQTIERNFIAELPVLTRNPYNSVGLSSGAVPIVNGSVRGVGYAINGQRPESANFLLDGSNYNTNPDRNNPGQTVPNEAVREYRLLTNSFTAEYGRGAGYMANLVTKSGTNEFHGSVYEYARSSALAANSFENNALGKRKPTLNGHQAGGSIGGPIVSDKAFFFGALDTTVIRSSEVQSYYVPTPQLVANSSPATQALFLKYPLPSSLSNTGMQTRTVKPFLRGVPVLTVPAFALASRFGPTDTGAGPPQNATLGIMRLDYTRARSMITTRYAFQHVDPLATVSQPYGSYLDPRVEIRNHNATINLTRVWSANTVAETRLSFSRLSNTRLGVGFNGLFQTFTVMLEPNINLPHGPASEGGPRNLYQAHQTASWVRRNHYFKFGGEVVHYRDALDVAFPGVSPAFFDVQDLVDGYLSWVTVWFDAAADGASGQIGGSIAPPNRRWHLRYNDAAWFVQDTWKLTRRLTLTPGLRWEYFGVQSSPGHEKARDVNFYLGEGATHYERFINGKVLRTTDAPGDYRNHFIRPDRNNFGPRAGLAFDLSGDGRTILRAGAGLFFDAPFGRVPPQIRANATFSNVPLTLEMLDNPYAIAGPALSSPPSIERADPDRRIPYVAAWNATIEREMAGKIALSGSYVGSSGSRLELAVVENEIGSGRYVGRPNQRLLNDYGPFTSLKSLAHSSYHSLQLKVEGRRIRPLGLQFGANYTWGHSIDNASAREEGVQGVLLDPNNLRLDRGSSSFDQRHRFVTHFIWEIPVIPAAPRFARELTARWQLSGILSFQTGQPFNLIDDRVDLNQYARPRVTGPLPRVLNDTEMIPDKHVPNRFLYLPANRTRDYDLSCIPGATPFACVPSIDEPLNNLLPRNFYRGPGSYFQDLALTRSVRLSEQVRLQLRAEAYNLLNHANRELVPGLSTGGYVLTSPQLAGNTVAGVLARYGGIPRQVVLAAKVIF